MKTLNISMMMSKKLHVFVVFIVALSLFLATDICFAGRYYPLQAGVTWKYQCLFQTADMFSKGNSTFSQKALKPRKLAGKKVIPVLYNNGNIVFMIEDSTGVYKFGTQKVDDIEPTIHHQPEYYLKYPLKAGTTWREKISTLLLKQKINDIPSTVTIEAVNDVVTVPAGTFKDCIRIKYTARQTVDMDKREGVGIQLYGKANIEIEGYDWYAPHVGFVKAIRKDSSNHRMLGSGQIVVLLIQFTK